MLTVKNISYQIGEKKLLDDVSANFEPGQLNLVIGPNGAGKSTFIKIIANQLKPNQGEVLYAGVNCLSLSISELAKIRSVLSQHIDLAFPLSVHEVVMMGRYPHFNNRPLKKDEAACEETMRFFDIWELKGRDFTTLSGGEKQRVHFARVLAQIWYPVSNAVRYLILDEPLTFLDIHYQFDFMKKIRALLKERDLVVIGVVHDLNLAARFADKIMLLHQGKILSFGDKRQVLSKDHIKTAYLLEPLIHEVDGDMYLHF